jgi:hypothetical protein
MEKAPQQFLIVLDRRQFGDHALVEFRVPPRLLRFYAPRVPPTGLARSEAWSLVFSANVGLAAAQVSKKRLFGSLSGHISTKKVRPFHGRQAPKVTNLCCDLPRVRGFVLPIPSPAGPVPRIRAIMPLLPAGVCRNGKNFPADGKNVSRITLILA